MQLATQLGLDLDLLVYEIECANYALLQASSLRITFSLLPNVMQRCDFYEGFSYTLETFNRQLEPLSEIALLNSWRKTSVEDALSTQSRKAVWAT
jgi:hypothetical protein